MRNSETAPAAGCWVGLLRPALAGMCLGLLLGLAIMLLAAPVTTELFLREAWQSFVKFLATLGG